ncbi:hypothetical protein K1719_014975 [Acacia pycnantha]|nr:hypothetical protein K1719_014975 [Acacia pycnantha]
MRELYAQESKDRIQVNNDELVVGSGSSSSVDRRGGCEKEGFECKKGNGGLEENVLENEDYIYTNSIP